PQVVVSSKRKPRHLIFDLVPLRQHNDRSPDVFVSQHPAHLEAVKSWHYDVQYYDVRTRRQTHFKTLDSVRGLDYRISPRFKVVRDNVANRLVVVHYKDLSAIVSGHLDLQKTADSLMKWASQKKVFTAGPQAEYKLSAINYR